jgi:hypothetical protein
MCRPPNEHGLVAQPVHEIPSRVTKQIAEFGTDLVSKWAKTHRAYPRMPKKSAETTKRVLDVLPWNCLRRLRGITRSTRTSKKTTSTIPHRKSPRQARLWYPQDFCAACRHEPMPDPPHGESPRHDQDNDTLYTMPMSSFEDPDGFTAL